MMKIPVAEMRQTVNMAKLIYFVSLKSIQAIQAIQTSRKPTGLAKKCFLMFGN